MGGKWGSMPATNYYISLCITNYLDLHQSADDSYSNTIYSFSGSDMCWLGFPSIFKISLSLSLSTRQMSGGGGGWGGGGKKTYIILLLLPQTTVRDRVRQTRLWNITPPSVTNWVVHRVVHLTLNHTLILSLYLTTSGTTPHMTPLLTNTLWLLHWPNVL